uniref:Uncharacterized protein n=1 Tax=Rhabditophanes sp. KR3021 TaxID=114890 RepID=A0AC35TUE4_9BILA
MSPRITRSRTNYHGEVAEADENAINALRNVFYSDLVKDHEVYEVVRVSPERKISSIEIGKLKCFGKKKVVAVCLDGIHFNEALGLEYAIIFDMPRELTNVDDSGQSNQVMYLKHPDIFTIISELAFKQLFHKISSNVIF